MKANPKPQWTVCWPATCGSFGAHAVKTLAHHVGGFPPCQINIYVACGNLVATPTAMPATGFGTRTIALGGAAGAVILGGLGAGISMIRRRVIASRG